MIFLWSDIFPKSRCYVSWISGRICGDRRIVRTDTAPIYKRALMSAVPELDPAISKTKKPVMLQGDVPSPIDTPVG